MIAKGGIGTSSKYLNGMSRRYTHKKFYAFSPMGEEPILLCFSLQLSDTMSFCIGGTMYPARCGWGQGAAGPPIRGRQPPAPNHT